MIFFMRLYLIGQNCTEDYKNGNKFKEVYDFLGSHKYQYSFPSPNTPLSGEYTALTYPFNNYTYPNNANDAVREFGNLESVGNILESLIRMYEITHDKAYLIKAINKSIQLMNARGGATAPSPHAWASGWNNISLSYNHDTYVPNVPGNILHPMAHLCHLILIDEYSTLCSATLPLSPENLIPNLPYLPQNTFGEFANWLVHQCVASLDWCLNQFWISNTIGFRDEYASDYGTSINQQAPYAAALFYLGHLKDIYPCFAYQGYYSGLQSYMDKASTLANLYTGTIELYKDNNDCYSSNENCFELPVFRYISETDSYWWHTNGWGYSKTHMPWNPCWSCNPEYRIKCSFFEDITPEQEIENGIIDYKDYRAIEDISHGIRTLIYPRILNKYHATSGGNLLFDNSKMLRFRNVIKNVAWNKDSIAPKFYSTVSGAGYDGNAPTSVCYPLPCPMDRLGWDVLNWVSIAENELPNSELYNILVSKFRSILNSNSIGNFANGGRMNALAEFTDQTWKRTCYDLTYYNRKLTYNQDFFAKHNLEIYPTADNCYHVANDESFADPIITANIFTIEPAVQSTISAGNSVSLKGEVYFKSGSEVEVKTIQNSCFTGGRLASNANGNYLNNNPGSTTPMDIVFVKEKPITVEVSSITDESKTEDFISITPHTNSIVVKSISPIKDVFIYSVSGLLVQTITNINESQREISFSNLSSGLYVVKAQNTHEVKTQKVNFLRN
jgi:hypothetical protein